MNKNTYTITCNAEIVANPNSLNEAYTAIRQLCRVETNVGNEYVINKNDEAIFTGIAVKQTSGKLTMMDKTKYTMAQKKHTEVLEKRATLAKEKADRKCTREAKKAAFEKTTEAKAQIKSNNAKINELYAQIKTVRDTAAKKKHAFLKAFKTVQAKEHEEIAAIKAQIDALLNENNEHKNNINTPAFDIQDAPEMTETAF